MKKILILATFVAVALNADAWTFKSSCGKECETVSPEYFENLEDALDFYVELDGLMCSGVDDRDHPAPDDSDDANP